MFSIVAVNVMFLFLPGIIGMNILHMFIHVNKKREGVFNFFILDSFVLGSISYLLVFLIVLGLGQEFHLLNITEKNLTLRSIDFREVGLAIIISTVLSIAYSLIKEHNFIFSLGSKIGLSNRTSQPHIIFDINKSRKKNNVLTSNNCHSTDQNENNNEDICLADKYAIVKVKNFPNREYYAHIRRISIHDDCLELLLGEVTVILKGELNRHKNEKTYDVTYLYLRAKFEDIIIKYIIDEGGSEECTTLNQNRED